MTNDSTTVYSASYDGDDDMTTRNGSPITWTVDDVQGSTSAAGGRKPGAANLPASLGAAEGSSTFSYGPDGNRYYQAAQFNNVTTDTTYIGGLFEVVSTSTTTEYRHNIVADGQVIAVHTIDQSGNATTDYLHYDHLGSVDTITNDQGTIAQSMSFDAFGLRRDPSNWDYDLTTAQISALKDDTDRGYTFQEELDNVGLIHMNGRVYDPSVGRFISADPIEGGNRYAYVYNNPLNGTDPTGFWGLGDLNPFNSNSPLNPVNVINTAGNAASGAINTLTGGAIDPGFSISRGDIENTFHHFDQGAANFLFRPDKTIEYNFPGLGNFTNVRFNHSKTMQRDVGYTMLAASVVVDVWSDGALTWFTSAIYAGYDNYVTSLNGGTMLQGAEQGGIAYATSYALGSANLGFNSGMNLEYTWADYGATIGADYGAASSMRRGDSSAQLALNSLFHGLEGYSIGSLAQGGYDWYKSPSAGPLSISTLWSDVTPSNVEWALETAGWVGAKNWLVNDLGADNGLSNTDSYDLKALLDFGVNVDPPPGK